ncbi:hypothetical protein YASMINEVIRUS_1516 [Yasminevirus sp. GU-2018]|uniref:Uncharacterized protein n=1 Tax=Yasminevirus sp. GU-2018 TaxID=2420051 RepID=A0A5K0UBQ5_9VIRU|nr:hypothetical protein YASMINEVIRUS_1516 [Yasminevirus sp. GU-2018]
MLNITIFPSVDIYCIYTRFMNTSIDNSSIGSTDTSSSMMSSSMTSNLPSAPTTVSTTTSALSMQPPVLPSAQAVVTSVASTTGRNYGALVGKTVADVYNVSDPSVVMLSTDTTYDFLKITENIKKATLSQKSPSVFVLPNTSITIEYTDGKSRVVTNKSTRGDVIHVNGDHVTKLTLVRVKPVETVQSAQPMIQTTDLTKKVEGFDIDCRTVTFTYYDLLVIIMIALIAYYVFRKD